MLKGENKKNSFGSEFVWYYSKTGVFVVVNKKKLYEARTGGREPRLETGSPSAGRRPPANPRTAGRARPTAYSHCQNKPGAGDSNTTTTEKHN